MGNHTSMRPLSNHLLVWFPTYAWLAASAVTPCIYYAKLKHEKVVPEQRKILVTQEVCRQIVSGAIGFFSSVAGIMLGSVLGRRSANKTLNKVIWGALINCFGYAVVRPLLGTDLFVYWMRRRGMSAFDSEEGKPAAMKSGASTPEQRIQRYFHGVQARSAMKFSGWA